MLHIFGGWQEWRAFHSPAESTGGAVCNLPSTPVRAERSRNIVPPRRIHARRNIARATHVYVMVRTDGAVKVGVSRNPKQRRNQLAVASPDGLILAHATRAGQGLAFLVEGGAKSLLAPMRLRGEWFNCSAELAALAIETALNGGLEARACVAAEIERHRLSAEWRRLCRLNRHRRGRGRGDDEPAEDLAWDAYCRHEAMMEARFSVLARKLNSFNFEAMRERLDAAEEKRHLGRLQVRG